MGGRSMTDFLGIVLARKKELLAVLSARKQETLIQLLKRLHENLPQVELATQRYITESLAKPERKTQPP